MERIVKSENETKAIGSEVTTLLKGGDIICLYGDLGAGKTTFVKGLAKSLGITDEILSPTFTLMNVYNVSSSSQDIKSLAHIDTYRLKNAKDLIEIGIEDYLGAPGVITIIEWPEKVAELLKNKKVLNIYFEHLANSERKIRVVD